MTPQEIQALIDAKIAGQGTAVDAGGALPKILSGILAQFSKNVLAVENNSEDPLTLEEALSYIKLNGKAATLDDLLNLDVHNTVVKYGFGEYVPCIQKDGTGVTIFCGFNYADGQGNPLEGLSIKISIYPDGYDSFVTVWEM